MRSSGNGHPIVCVQNLLRMVRGENPYERCKGINPSLIDKPYNEARPQLIKEAKWLIKTYEPRVNLNDVNVENLIGQNGSFALDVNATYSGGTYE